MPAVDPRVHDVIPACRPAQLTHQNATLAPSPHGKAGKATDIVTLSRLWKHASSNARGTIQSVAGASTALLWSDCSRGERSGWLQDHHFQQALLNQLSRWEASAHRHHKSEHTRGSCAECRSTDPPLCCQHMPQSGSERGSELELELVLTFEAAEALRAQHGGPLPAQSDQSASCPLPYVTELRCFDQ